MWAGGTFCEVFPRKCSRGNVRWVFWNEIFWGFEMVKILEVGNPSRANDQGHIWGNNLYLSW